MPHQFEHYAAKGNELLNTLAAELEIPGNKKAAARILRAVLHALRDQITVEESIQLLAQLPMALKAMYVDGWSARTSPHPKTLNGFLFNVIRNDGVASLSDFTLNADDVAYVTATVFRVLGRYVSEGEYKDIIAVLPPEIGEFVKESVEQ